ncbi:hypothetical protein AA313_de0203591 [Arthrobotrys entomopaga]|nr:hypothetical protein AA313_de0203591 [Arthrobotrys entomopaga]
MRLLVLLLLLGQASALSYTKYYTMTTYVGSGTTTSEVEVYATGPIPISKRSVTTTSVGGVFLGYPNYAYANVTLTYALVGTDAPVCEAYKECDPPASNSNGIVTEIYGPIIITNRPSCTGSSFSYTTSSLVSYEVFGFSSDLPNLFDQATDTGPEGAGLFVTTYTTTVTHNLGGQPIIATSCTIWLKEGVVELKPGNRADYSITEDEFLNQCGDPRSYLCDRTQAGNCGTEWIGSYPPTATAAMTTSPGSADSSDGSENSAASQRVVAGRNALLLWNFVLVGLGMLICFFL